jgi:two-component system chemotaxis sensor kinase CheA
MTETDENFSDESMSGMVARLRETFREEAYDLIAEIETALLELEKTPGNKELINRVFRGLHTIKGSGAACEMTDIASFAHEVESFFEQVRKGKMAVTKKIIDLTLSARDHIKSMFDSYYKGAEADASRAQEIVASFRSLPSDSGITETDIPPLGGSRSEDNGASRSEDTGKNVTYRIRFRPSSDIIEQETDPIQLLSELRQLGYCKIVAQTDSGPSGKDFDTAGCCPCWDAILTTSRGTDAIQDVFILAKDHGELKIEVIDEEGNFEDEASYKRLGEILLERGDLTSEDLHEVLRSRKRIGEMLVETGTVCGDKVQSALVEQQHVRELRGKRQGTETTSSVRVSTDRLDSLVNLVGELVTVQARLSQSALSHGITEFIFIAEEVERLIAELRDNTLSIRMMPIGTTFSRFKRLVRDLSTELGKDVELVTEGEETELDKTVIERLGDPLVHLIRNCIDHGIEAPGARETAGKPRCGTIRLSAEHSGGNVLIRVQDDGAGLDTDAIRSRALERGIIRADAKLSDRELQSLIFAPGFSTARNVTSVSGRGVGLDVVKKSIDTLRGTIEISNTQGAGTAITLKLPLTLAIIDGFLTRIGPTYFVFPLSLVAECVELTGEDRRKAKGMQFSRHLINVRGEIVPYVRLRDQFMISGEPPAAEQVIITGSNGSRVGFAVDHVIGNHQTVIKNLGKCYRDVEGISGATILGDGAVALILDVPKLVQTAVIEEREHREGANTRG